MTLSKYIRFGNIRLPLISIAQESQHILLRIGLLSDSEYISQYFTLSAWLWGRTVWYAKSFRIPYFAKFPNWLDQNMVLCDLEMTRMRASQKAGLQPINMRRTCQWLKTLTFLLCPNTAGKAQPLKMLKGSSTKILTLLQISDKKFAHVLH